VSASPRFHRSALKRFLLLSETERSDLVRALNSLGVMANIATLIAEVSKALNKAPSESEPLVRWFLAMSVEMQRSEQDAGSFADAILQEIEFNEEFLTGEERDVLREHRPQLATNLVGVLTSEASILTTAKAIDVSNRGERVVVDSRITSDIRPVFSDTTTGPGAPLSAVLLHTLRLECASELQHHHFVLTTSELERLRCVVERAQDKEKLLRSALTSGLRLPVFSDEDE
jgi:hypothetical protein